MIPKIIHYCWFGPNEKPKSVKRYIERWKIILPDYEIKEWNESNFDIECCDYVKQAYAAKKFAFVSDYARLKALYEYGGVYLDTDVEVVQCLTPLFDNHRESDVILGFEEKDWVCTSTIIAQKNSQLILDFLSQYNARSFVDNSGNLDMKTNVEVLTEILIKCGLKANNSNQELIYKNRKITIMPKEYLSPMDYINRIDNRNENTYTVHHFDISWGKKKEFYIRYIKLAIVAILGKKLALKFWTWFR
ncbi:glycosyltransferase family 32 protein [Vibrio sp. OPT18]|uniref:glycosyltransferase family 32 protein n=1 Tax=Vibrio sp. OPT18 TaxID=2778641 RepID=UPI0018825B7C|nr:glycosyltransferase [Vibrio sp. OPT18]MBE8578484.1 glycosyl transferase [Vibrio sp. OPT18]